MKYRETAIVLSEIPDHITLAINISGCPIHCPECHSKYLWEDVGEELNESSLTSLIENNPDVNCVCFMGGDNEPNYVINLAKYVREHYPSLALGWYSGMTEAFKDWGWYFDYLKIGPFIAEKGPINKPTTNQKMYKVINRIYTPGPQQGYYYEDITNRFWNT